MEFSNARLLINKQSPVISAKKQSTITTLTRQVISWKLAVIFSPVLGVEPVRGSGLVFPTLTPVPAILLQEAAN